MKKFIAITGLLALTAWPASATIFTVSSGSLNAGIADGNPVGYVNSLIVNDPNGGAAVRDVNVLLDITGGYNGDLYGYLVDPTGQLVLLLNRVGTGLGGAVQQSFGYADAGFNNITLDDSAATGIHAYGGGGAPTG
ncbi:MAG: hypothetical protein NTZ16_15455 [Verrucomicrobia bacterium]|nr:hypothetical protein [Verrucomicrobiota bacterium]